MKTRTPRNGPLAPRQPPIPFRHSSFVIRHSAFAALSLLFCLSTGASPQLAWEARYNFGLPTNNHQVVSMTLDNAGDIIIAGNQLNLNRDLDYAILKYSQTGTLLWARTYASSLATNDQVRAMAVDGNGNVYVTGTSKTVKYNRNGQLLWVAPYAGMSVAVDSNRFVYVVGFQTTDFATVKLAPQGTNVWLRTFDRGLANDIAQAVAVGPSGEVYVGGIVTWRCDELGCYVWFELVKYDADGNQLWTRDYPGGGFNASTSEIMSLLALDADRIYLGGNFYFHGGIYTAALFDEGGTNHWSYGIPAGSEGMTGMVVLPSGEVYMTGRLRSVPTMFYRTVALNTTGTERWHVDFGPVGTYHRANGIALDAMGNVFVTGQAADSYFWPPPSFDFLTIKYDNDGRLLWTKRYSGPANRDDIAIGIAVTPDGGIFIAGQSANTNGGTDITLLKYVELENIQWLPNGTVLLQFPASPGQSARFQASTNLITWQDIATVTPSPEGIARYTDTTVSQHPRRFYRLALP